MRLVWHQDFGLGVRGSEWDSTQVAVFGFVDDSRNIQSGRGFFEHLEEGCGKKIEDCGLMRKRNQTVMLRSNNFDSTT